MFEFEIKPTEANRWWERNTPLGVLMNRLMLLLIVAPIVLVFIEYYAWSFVVFVLMVPYGFFVRHLAVRAVRDYLSSHPESIEEFETHGIISS